jgi:hypothetical protein
MTGFGVLFTATFFAVTVGGVAQGLGVTGFWVGLLVFAVVALTAKVPGAA